MRIRSTLAMAACLAAGMATASAQEPLNLEVGFTHSFQIPGDVKNVVVGSPSVADVLPLAQNAYLLNAIGVGTTNVVAFNEQGEQLYYARVVVRPVDIWPYFPIRVTNGVSQSQRFMCDPNLGCRPVVGNLGPCMNPDDIAADGTRCGDRAAGVRPAGVNAEGQQEVQ